LQPRYISRRWKIGKAIGTVARSTSRRTLNSVIGADRLWRCALDLYIGYRLPPILFLSLFLVYFIWVYFIYFLPSEGQGNNNRHRKKPIPPRAHHHRYARTCYVRLFYLFIYFCFIFYFVSKWNQTTRHASRGNVEMPECAWVMRHGQWRAHWQTGTTQSQPPSPPLERPIAIDRVVYYHPFFKIKKFDHFVLCGDTHREFPLSSEEEEEK
jgi:hypothetical protein